MRVDAPASSMLTVREVSQLLHVHSNTLRRWSDQGVLRAYRIGPRGDRRFKPEDIAVLLLEQTREAPVGARSMV
jgi:excisionase family DNA binding protein